MAKKDADLFDRLRQVGLRKQAAKALSGVSDTAGKQAQRAARAAVSELRAVADEIERRLPAATPASGSSGEKQRSNLTRSRDDTAEHESFRRADAKGRYRETQARTPQLDHPSGRSRIPLTANAAACGEYRARRTDAGSGTAAARGQYRARRTGAGYAIAAGAVT